MNDKKVIFAKADFRVVEVSDLYYSLEDLMGDSFSPECNPEIDVKVLAEQKADFIFEVETVGCYGYVLEKWNPEVGQGWTHVDSCFGFVGSYDPSSEKYNHYIVEELKSQIEKIK